MKIKRKLWLRIIPSAFIISIILVCGYSYLPLSKKQIRQSIAKIECQYCYALTENGKNIAFFNDIEADSVLVNFTYNKKAAIRTVNHNAYWINKFQIIPWQSDLSSAFIKEAEATFVDILGFRPRKVAMHFALECGYFVQKYPGIEIVSIGPKIIEPHSVTERVSISTINDIWKVFIHLLYRMAK